MFASSVARGMVNAGSAPLGTLLTSRSAVGRDRAVAMKKEERQRSGVVSFMILFFSVWEKGGSGDLKLDLLYFPPALYMPIRKSSLGNFPYWYQS